MVAMNGAGRVGSVNSGWRKLPGQPRDVDARTVQMLRLGSAVAAVGWFVFAAALYVRADWAVALWPWPDVRMSFIFLALVAAAIGAPILLLLRIVRDSDDGLALTTTFFALFTLGNVVLFWWSHALPVRDRRRMPEVVRGAFVIFALTLVAVGTAMALQVDHIFPWDLSPRSSTVFGWIYIGASAYFVYGVFRPMWAFASGTLWGFLAYDVVLFSPYIAMLFKDEPVSGFDPYGYGVTASGGNGVNESSLVIYLIVLTVSSLLAIWTLALRRETRVWGDT